MHRCKDAVTSFLAVSIVFVLVFATSTMAQSADERAIRAAAEDWAKAALHKDVDKCVSFYADDAHMYPFNSPRTETKADIRREWTNFLTTPGAVLETKTTSVTAAESGDLAYETGTFELTQNDTQGKPSKTPGKYVVVWKKQANHEWKAVADIFNTDK